MDVKISEFEKLKQDVSNHYIQQRLQAQGLQQKMEEVFKPITRSIALSSVAMGNKFTELYDKLSNKINELTAQMTLAGNKNSAELKQEIINLQNQQQWIEVVLNKMYNSPGFSEMLKLLENQPNIIKKLNGENVEVDEQEDGIFNLVLNLPPDQVAALRQYYTFTTEETSPAKTPPSLTPVKLHKLTTEPSPIEVRLLPPLPKIDEEGLPEKGLPEYIKSITKEDAKNSSDEQYNSLKEYLVLNPNITVNARYKPYTYLNEYHPGFTDEIHEARKQKTGTGIKQIILSSDPKELLRRLALLLGSYKAGNNNIFNEISATMDELQRMGKITNSKVKQIYKFLRTKISK